MFEVLKSDDDGDWHLLGTNLGDIGSAHALCDAEHGKEPDASLCVLEKLGKTVLMCWYRAGKNLPWVLGNNEFFGEPDEDFRCGPTEA